MDKFRDDRKIGYKKIRFDVEEILANQEMVFLEFVGVSPSPHIRIKSPFRKEDASPGCRFKLYKGSWWLIDNATYRNKLYFNCIETVMYLYNLNFKDACILISERLNLTGGYDNLYNIDNYLETPKFGTKIRFTYKDWENTDYFPLKYGIDISYLKSQPYYNVENYWTSTKTDPILKINRFGIPKNKIAYYFDETENVKLYFPDSHIVKWYANTTNEDIFGYHRMGEYLFSENRTLFLTGSGKDELCLNYFLGANSLGFQSEGIKDIPEKLLRNMRYFKEIIIWMDADRTGIDYSRFLEAYFKKMFPTKIIRVIEHNPALGKDIADLSESMGEYICDYFKNI